MDMRNQTEKITYCRCKGARESKLDLNNIMYGRMKAENIVHDACVMSAQGYA